MSAAEVIASALEAHWGSVAPRQRVQECCTHAALDALNAAGYAVIELPEPNSTRYDGDEHEPEDRLGWWQDGSLFGVSQWGYRDQVQLTFDGEPFEPLTANEARFIAAALLAAADAAEATS